MGGVVIVYHYLIKWRTPIRCWQSIHRRMNDRAGMILVI